MTLLADAQFCSNMLRRSFIALYLLVFGVLLSPVECRTEPIDRKLSAMRLSRNVVQCKTATKLTEHGTSICNDDSSEDAELEKARNVENGTRYSDGDAVEEGRGKKNKGGGGKMLLYLIGATKATMLYIMIHAVAALAGKALIVAKVALAIATAVALKKALEHEKTSYEIVKHPYHSYIQTHSSSVDYDHHGGGYESGYGHRKRRRITR